MMLTAGFVGFSQDQQTKALRPEIGWAVAEKDINARSPQNDPIDLADLLLQKREILIKYTSEVDQRLSRNN